MNTPKEISNRAKHILTALKAEADKETSATEFTKHFLPFGPSKWSKILNAIDPALGQPGGPASSYFDEVSDATGKALIDDLESILTNIPLQRAQAERFQSSAVLDLSHFRAVKVAIEECCAKRTPERLVKYLAPTGGGKSMLCTYLAAKCDAKIVESREAWKRSNYTVLEDLCRAMNIRIGKEVRPAVIEDKLVSHLSSQKTVLAIDEGEFFGAAALNGLKLLLNKTRLVIVICAIPEAHDRWNHYFRMESEQLDRRTHAVVRLSTVSPEDTARFFPPNQFMDRNAALKLLCEQASRFGHYSLLNRVAIALAGKERCDGKETHAALAKALEAMNRIYLPPTNTLEPKPKIATTK